MIDNTIIIACISLIGTIAGSLFGVLASNRLVDFRLKSLEEKVNKHNNLIERMALVEASTKSAHKRIDTLLQKEVANG